MITAWIAKNGMRSRADFAEFYRRRARRIFPALFLVLLVTQVAGVFILAPKELEELSRASLASILSIANIYFTYAVKVGYFSDGSDTLPLLHLWSLGVEEQFYVFWPIFLAILLRHRKYLHISLWGVILLSVVLGEYLLRAGHESFAYYMLPTRAFQLAAGGLCYFMLVGPWGVRLTNRTAMILSASGMGLVLASAACLSADVPFPGLSATPLTFGASLLILGGARPHVITRALCIRPVLFFGNISFSLYLWHWPILAYMRYASIEITPINGALAFLAVVALATFSWFFVEQKTRHTVSGFLTVTVKYFAVPAAGSAIIAAMLLVTKGFGPYALSPWYVEAVKEAKRSGTLLTNTRYVCHRDALTLAEQTRPECAINASGKPDALLWGDSHGAHHVGLLRVLAETLDFSFRNISHSACPPLLDGASTFANPRYRASCERSIPVVASMVNDYDTIILAASWHTYSGRPGFLDAVERTITSLADKGKNIIIIGHMPMFRSYSRDCAIRALKLGTDCEARYVSGRNGKAWNWVDQTNRRLAEMAGRHKRVSYIDFSRLVCNEFRCSPYLDGFGLYFDQGHLNVEGSERLGRLAAADPYYVEAFSQAFDRPVPSPDQAKPSGVVSAPSDYAHRAP